MDREIKNAVIKSAQLMIEDHNFLTAWLHLDYGGTGQGFGGYTLHLPNRGDQGNYAGIFLRNVLEIAGVTEWKDLPGKTIRADSDGGKVYRIGHIIENRWFDPAAEFERLK